MKILVVEDEDGLRDMVRESLEKEKYIVECASDYQTALTKVQEYDYDCVLLDIMLPGGSGLGILSALKRLRKQERVIILSAKDSVDDKIKGLDMGADDYLAKPFSLLELIARVKALFRRQEAMGQNLLMDAGRLSCHGLSIDPLSREVKLRGETVDLTPREFDLLYYFARHPGEVFSRLALLEQVWGYQHEGYEHTVNTHINRLRSKIERDPAEPDIILTVWGKGYKFAPVTQEAAP